MIQAIQPQTFNQRKQNSRQVAFGANLKYAENFAEDLTKAFYKSIKVEPKNYVTINFDAAKFMNDLKKGFDAATEKFTTDVKIGKGDGFNFNAVFKKPDGTELTAPFRAPELFKQTESGEPKHSVIINAMCSKLMEG